MIYSTSNFQVYSTELLLIFSLPHALLAGASLSREDPIHYLLVSLQYGRIFFFSRKTGEDGGGAKQFRNTEKEQVPVWSFQGVAAVVVQSLSRVQLCDPMD